MRDGAADDAFRYRKDDLVFAFELVIDRALGDPYGVGDHLIRRRAHPVFGEQLNCGVQRAQLGRTPRRRSKPLARLIPGSHRERVYPDSTILVALGVKLLRYRPARPDRHGRSW
jgi:hypothetical protein